MTDTLTTLLAQLPPSAENIYTALGGHPDSTAAQVAVHAGVGRSTAQNALRTLESAGLVTRHQADASGAAAGRQADIWNVADTDRSASSKPKAAKPKTAKRAATKPTVAKLTVTKPKSGRMARSRSAKVVTVDETPSVSPSSSRTKNPAGSKAVALAKTPPRSTTSLAEHKARRSRPENPENQADQANVQSSQNPALVLVLPVGKLGKGELQQLVLEQMQSMPTEEWSATQLSRALDRSQGAIANALDRFTQRGLLEMCNNSPRRYRLVEADDPETAADDEQPEQELVEATATSGHRKGRSRRK